MLSTGWRVWSNAAAKLLGENISKAPPEIPIFTSHEALAALLPYESVDPDSNLFFNRQSIGFILEVSPLLGSSEAVEALLASLLTDRLPAGVDMQFLLVASPQIGPILDAFAAQRSRNPLFTWLAEKRVEFLKKGVFASLTESAPFVLRDFRVYISVSLPQKHRLSNTLLRLREDIQSTLQSIPLPSRVLGPEEFLQLLTHLVTPHQNVYPETTHWNPLEPLATQIPNPEWELQVTPQALHFSSEKEKVEARCLSVRTFPERFSQGQAGENCGQLFNAMLHIPCPFWISFHVRKIEGETAHRKAQMKTLNRDASARSPLSKFKPSLRQECEDWQYVRERLGAGDALLQTLYHVVVFAEPSQVAHCEQRLRDLYRANGWKLCKDAFLQLPSWLACLPMISSEGLFEDFQRWGRLKTLTALNAVSVAPLQGEWKGSRTPSLLLPGRRGQIALWNPFDNTGGNYNMAITAAPGKGKSAFTQEYIVALLGAGARVWVIDAGRSYEKTCRLLGGQFMAFTPHAAVCLNPFTTVTDITESLVLLKPLLASMARPLTGASEIELAFLEQAIKAAWAKKGRETTVTTVAQWLEAQPDPVCPTLAQLLFSFTDQGAYATFFEGPCTVDFASPFIVLELQELKAKKELQRVVLHVLIVLISQAMYAGNRSQIKSCIIDESWDLLDDDNTSTAKFIEAGYRTARKFRGNFVAIAHSIADFQRNAMSRAAFDCSDFKIILGQSSEAINALKTGGLMDIDGFTERLLKSLRLTPDYAECVIKGPEGLSVHRILFDPYSRILYSTKGEEFDAVNQHVERGLPLIDAIALVAEAVPHA